MKENSSSQVKKLCNLSQSIKCQCCPHIETSQLICKASQLTSFYMRAIQPFNGLIPYGLVKDKNGLDVNALI